MTPEQQKQQRDAEVLALACGGVLAVLLGIKAAERPILWDAATGRFIIGEEQVAMVTIRDSLARLQSYTGSRMAKLAGQLFAGTITLDAWRSATMDLIMSSHILAGALATGSIATAMTIDKLGRRIGEQEQYADGLSVAVEERKQGVTLRRVKARATSYVAAVGVTFAVLEQDLRKELGISVFAYRSLNAKESCAGCEAWAGQWIPIDDMVPIGDLECSSFCKCEMSYS